MRVSSWYPEESHQAVLTYIGMSTVIELHPVFDHIFFCVLRLVVSDQVHFGTIVYLVLSCLLQYRVGLELRGMDRSPEGIKLVQIQRLQ